MFTLDIETVPDETKIETFDRFHLDKFIEENGPPKKQGALPDGYTDFRISQMSLTPAYAKLAGLGFWLDGEKSPVSVMVGDVIQSKEITEEMLLRKFWTLAPKGPCVGFNVIAFDVQIIRLRSMDYGIEPTVDYREVKPWEKNKLFDLANALYGKHRLDMKQTFELLCRGIDIPEKYGPVLDFNGSMVYDALQKEGGRDTVRLYQEYDVWREAILAQKIMNYF